jgi:hypothetical protein
MLATAIPAMENKTPDEQKRAIEQSAQSEQVNDLVSGIDDLGLSPWTVVL